MRYGHFVMSLFCAWVLWSKGYSLDQKTGMEETWSVIDAHEAKTECSTQAQKLEGEKKREAEKEGRSRLSHYQCLPDTVDPRAPTAGK